MWRAIFALSHADRVVTDEERRFMLKALDEEPFSDDQRRILRDDMEKPQNVAVQFGHITDPEDRHRFFYFARMLTWCDGDFSPEEQKMVMELERMEVFTVDFEEMIGKIDMKIEGETRAWLAEDIRKTEEPHHVWEQFLRRFGS